MSLRLDGLLDQRTQAELEQHIKTCARCLSDWTALQEADNLLRAGARRVVTPPPDFLAQVMIRVAQVGAESRRRSPQRGQRTISTISVAISARCEAPPHQNI